MWRMRWWVAAAIAMAACGDTAAGRELPGTVLVRTDPATVAECPYGGSVVGSGLDSDRDGVLEDGEVQTRTVLCNAPPVGAPPPIVIRLVAEPIGAHCAEGGTAVQSGPDRNGNGRLDDDEVVKVDYACGEALVTRLVAEPPGARCVAGGVVFQLGRDLDRDGLLGDDEVEQAEVECGDVLSRDVSVQTAAEVAALAGITIIGGSLAVNAAALTELALPHLVQVRGSLEIADDNLLQRVAAPVLQTIGGRLTLARDGQLATIEAPQLHRVGGLVIDGNAGLHDLTGLPALSDIVGEVNISRNASLVYADLTAAALRGELTVEDNAALAHASWTFGFTAGAVHIARNLSLETVDLGQPFAGTAGAVTIASNPVLRHVAIDGFQIAGLAIDDNPALVEASLAVSLVTGPLAVRGNGPLSLTLTALSQSELGIAGSLSLSGPIAALHSRYPLVATGDCTIDATQLASLDQLNQVMQCGGAVHVTGNPRLAAIPVLAVGSSLEVRGNAALRTLPFLAQDEIAGDLEVSDNAVLHDAPSLELLRRVRGNVTIAGNPALKQAFGPGLEQVDGELVLQGNVGLVEPGLAHLQHVRSLTLAGCPLVTELALPALSELVTRIDVTDNAALQHLALPLLRRADLGVFDNPQLPTCELEALFAALLGDHQQSGNDDATVCGR